MNRFEISDRALRDLREISQFISQDNLDAADRVIEEFYEAFHDLARMPGIGHKREDLTQKDVLFWPVHSYLIIYAKSSPLRIVRVVHGRRDVKKLLKKS